MNELVPQPSVTQANRSFLLLLLLLLVGSVLLVPVLGMGGNLWVNELVYILLPPIFLARRGRWNWRESFRLRPITGATFLHCLLIGAVLWIFNAVLLTMLELWTGSAIGTIPVVTGAGQVAPLQAVCLLLGMVVLAPLCEELFFRGFLQRAYETAFGSVPGLVIAGLLFGSMHILNGMNNLLPASLLGLALGYLAFRTGSIWASVAMHAGTNLMSRLGVLLLPQLVSGAGLSSWMYGLALAALLLGVGLLAYVGRVYQPTVVGRPAERPQLARSLALWLSALLLLATAGSEVAMRAGLITAVTGMQPQTVLSAGEVQGEMSVLQISVQESDVGKSLAFRYELQAAKIAADLRLLDPQGEVVWEKNWQGEGLTIQTGDQLVDVAQAGEWQLIFDGMGEGLQLKAAWRLQP